MTLDDAIAKAKADGDVQLAEWLRQARGADAAARWYTEKLRDANRTIRKLLDENAKLREERREYQATIDSLVDECADHKDENAKLRRLARQMYPYAKAHLQLGVALGCNDTLSYDWALQMVELGIEVPE